MLSSLISLVSVEPVAAVNETTSGTVTGTETWSNSITLTDDVTVGEGAKLIINAGTTVNIPAGKYIDVKGSICAGASACGATQGSTGSMIKFKWSTPNYQPNNTGRCYTGMNNPDEGCGSGVVIRSTIDITKTKFSFVEFDNAYGIPVYVQSSQSYSYGTLIFEGSSPVADHLVFKNINTSNILAIDFAAPDISDSTFVVGNDGNGYEAAAVISYNAGSSINVPFKVTGSTFTGTEPDCGQQGGGRSLLFLEDSFIALDSLTLKDNAYGLFAKGSSGWLTNSTLTIKCNGIDTNGHKMTGQTAHFFTIDNNQITTDEGAGITAYDQARIKSLDNTISGASSGSGIAIKGSEAIIQRNTIGPIAGWNGVWIYGESDVVLENSTISQTEKEPVLIGEYHYKDQGWNVPSPGKARLHMQDNDISGNDGTCNSEFMYGGDFQCPAIHVFMASASIIDNNVMENSGEAIRAKGAILNVQGNTMDVGDTTAVRISHFDDNYGSKYATLGYFSGNTWNGTDQPYNITESSVTVQSETFPPATPNVPLVDLTWLGAECPQTTSECVQLWQSSEWPPLGMPLAMDVNHNATTFTYADLQGFTPSDASVKNQNTAWGSQIQKGELVRFRITANNNHVAGADVEILDAHSRSLYNLTSDAFGYTPWVTLPSDIHLDRNWNNIIESNENSCLDGLDNDGDQTWDLDVYDFDGDGIDELVSSNPDSDCLSGNREISKYKILATKFGKGSALHEISLTALVDDVIELSNIKPSVSVNQYDGHSFARVVTLTGSAHDGVPGPYFNDLDAQKKQFGTIRKVQIQPPGSTDWKEAIDTSGAQGQITQNNHPFKTWSYEFDMSNMQAEDVTFRVRAFDGLDDSPVLTRKYKLNVAPPTVLVDTPKDQTVHDDGHIRFTGTAADDYVGTWGSDIKKIWFDIKGPENYHQLTSTEGASVWSFDWDFSELATGEYVFTIWASDSDFCKEGVGECVAEVRTLQILNDNAIPWVYVDSPDSGDVIRASEDTIINGTARDNDGIVSRVEVHVYDIASGINMTTLVATQFDDNGYWEVKWDTSDLIHDQQYEFHVFASDGEDYSSTTNNVYRITISNPANEENIRPNFVNAENWSSTIIIYCDTGSNSADRCGEGATINLLDYFVDPDGKGDPSAHFRWNIPNDPTTAIDDNYFDYIEITPEGMVTYNPATSIGIVSKDLSTWSLFDVTFEARDIYGDYNITYEVTFLVKEIEFTAEQVSGETISGKEKARFQGTGLPGEVVSAKVGDLVIGQVAVDANGNWLMELSVEDMRNADSDIVFYHSGNPHSDNPEDSFEVSIDSSDSGSTTLIIWIAVIVVAVLLLAGLGYFFVEFEEIDDHEFDETDEVKEDPYAWAKQKAVPDVSEAQVQTETAATSVESQHPGWLWDAANNQWVPDPNYVHEQN